MSYIDKMTIQGIRSFGPGDENRGMIQFFMPLTLILGPNGTGKTTIIECLKYITTGELPPGGRNNAAFINDPKVARETEVKAQVRLQFHDVRGDKCLAQRSIVGTQKKTKVEFKTLDGLIQKRLSNGEVVTINSKCAETDREMISLLGVSKPILENVIFCHQEDSNWPLSEGKALKMKFDDIFASTRYVKALDVIVKCRKEQAAQINVYKSEMKHLRMNKSRVQDMQSRLQDLEDKQQVSVDGMKKVDVKLQPVVDKLKTLEEREDDIRTISNSVAKLEGEKNQLNKIIQDLQKNIKKSFQGSLENLDVEIAEFREKMQEKVQSLKSNQDKQSIVDTEVAEVNRQRSKVIVEHTRLQQDAERNKKNISDRNKLLQQIVTYHKLIDTLLDDPNSDEAHSFIRQLQQKLERLNGDIKFRKEEYSRKSSDVQMELNRKREMRTKLETECRIKEDNLRRNKDEILRLDNSLNKMNLSVGKLDGIKSNIQKLEVKMSEVESRMNVDDMKQDVQRLQRLRSSLDSEVRSLDRELSELNQTMGLRTQLDIYNKDKSSKEENIRKILSKNEDTLKHVLGSVTGDSLKRKLDEYIREQSKKVRGHTDKLQKMKSQLTKLETMRKIEQENLKKKQDELRGFEEKISNITQGKDFMEGLNALMVKLQTSQDNKGHLMAVEYMFKKYIDKLHRENPDCPLCHRPFDEQTEVEELITEMEGKLNIIPEKMEKLQESILETNRDYEAWLQLNPIRDAMVALRDNEIPKIEASIQTLNEEITPLMVEINEKEEELEVDSNDEVVAKSLTSDATVVERLYMEVNELNRKVTAQKNKLTSDSCSRSVEQVQTEKKNKMDELDNTSKELTDKQTSLDQHQDELRKLQNHIHQLKDERLKIETEFQSRLKLESNKVDLTKQNEQLLVQIQKAKEDVLPVNSEIDEITKRKNNIEVQHEADVNKDAAMVSKLNDDMKQLKSMQAEIDKYDRDDCNKMLQNSTSTLKALHEKLKVLEQQRSDVADVVEQLKEDLATQETLKRDLEDNRKLLKTRDEVMNIETKVKCESDKLGGYNVEELLKEKNTLKRDVEKLKNERDQYKNRHQQWEGEIKSLNRELTSAPLVTAEKDYNEMMITLRTTEVANEDLEKYYKALDKTIMSYHNQKMAEINKIIRELWRDTYKGQDIEAIEIRSDEEEGSGAAKTRRNYHYRVVMMNAGVELDMRGRCSAGQKVLASLIIRLALAETFCLNCGVLALDEPTTNLDRENIESLAYALVEIIKSRSKQKNFQLVVITHDEDFVELLGRSEFVEEFFRVKKDEITNCSKIYKSKIATLQTK